MPAESGRPMGLRERKKRAAMQTIQRVALDLFDRDGYGNVTIERIAEAAEVSPSSIYRYFGTKERLVLWDEYDPELFALMQSAQGDVSSVLNRLRQGIATIIQAWPDDEVDNITRRMRYILSEPDVHAAMLREQHEFEVAIRHMIAPYIGESAEALRVRVAAATLLACLTAALYHWADTGYTERLADVLDEALTLAGRSIAAQVGQLNATSQTAM